MEDTVSKYFVKEILLRWNQNDANLRRVIESLDIASRTRRYEFLVQLHRTQSRTLAVVV